MISAEIFGGLLGDVDAAAAEVGALFNFKNLLLVGSPYKGAMTSHLETRVDSRVGQANLSAPLPLCLWKKSWVSVGDNVDDADDEAGVFLERDGREGFG